MTPEALAALVPDAVVGTDGTRLRADVAPGRWAAAAAVLRDAGLDYLDLLTAVDEQQAGTDVVVHLWGSTTHDSVLLRTRLPPEDLRLPSLSGVFAGAAWHEREVAEMFGVDVEGHPGLVPLLLPDGFDGHPLRKAFVLASRVARPWPGAPEPGQSSAEAATGRRRVLPPGVPRPGTWPAGERA